MSWHYSQALVAAYSGENSSGGGLSALLKSMPSAAGFYSHGKMTDHCQRFQSGMTLERLTVFHGEALLTWFLAASHAKTSASPAKALDSAVPGPGSGEKCAESLMRFDPATCSWKTPRPCDSAASTSFSGTWPQWGSMQNGECWARSTPAHPTSANGSGLWQAPVADDAVSRPQGKFNSRGEPKLSAQVQFPTPLASDSRAPGPSGPTRQGGMSLQVMVRQFPTPTARDYRSDSSQKTSSEIYGKKGQPLPRAVGGLLNPPWVEWLMGWPIGWTELKPLETGKCQQWRHSHGKSSTPLVVPGNPLVTPGA